VAGSVTNESKTRAYPYDDIEIEFARFLLDPVFEGYGDYEEFKNLVVIVYGSSVDELAAQVNPSDMLGLADAAEVEIEAGS
jgi:hypothetical protein